jgi:hypothetical protein
MRATQSEAGTHDVSRRSLTSGEGGRLQSLQPNSVHDFELFHYLQTASGFVITHGSSPLIKDSHD